MALTYGSLYWDKTEIHKTLSPPVFRHLLGEDCKLLFLQILFFRHKYNIFLFCISQATALKLSTLRATSSVRQGRRRWKKPLSATWEQTFVFCCRIASRFCISGPEAAWLYMWLKHKKWVSSFSLNVFLLIEALTTLFNL